MLQGQAAGGKMEQYTIALSEDERAELTSLLLRELGEVKVEARRTDDRSFRRGVLHEKQVIRDLLRKLGHSAE
jgi:hypothetical protein